MHLSLLCMSTDDLLTPSNLLTSQILPLFIAPHLIFKHRLIYSFKFSAIKSMSVSGIQPVQMKVSVMRSKVSEEVWQHLYVVIEYGGKKYEPTIQDRTFEIEFIEGLNEMDIFLWKENTEAVFAKLILDEGLVCAIEMVPLYTSSGSNIGDVILGVQFSGKFNMEEIPNSALEYNVDIEDISGKKITTGEEIMSCIARNEIEELINSALKYSMKVRKISKENNASDGEILRSASKIKVQNAAEGTSSRPSDNIKVTEKLNALEISKANITSVESSGGFFDELKRNTPKKFSLEDLRKFTSDFAHKVGKGAFGSVYKGQFDDGMKIVVKVLEENDLVQKSFKAEVSTMFNTSHRNIVKFYGYCFDHNMKAIVYEYMENGSLDAVLYGNPFKLEWRKFYEISIATAKGLSYLHHECDHQILHHDLKPANILLDKTFSAKITDFGLARHIDKDLTHITWTNCGGTRGYMAPEIFMQSSKITSKCDVYSFGMILFEVLRRKRNNDDADSVWFPKKVWLKFHNGELEQLLDDCGIGEEEDRARAKILCMVALWCSQFMPEARPSMSEVVMMLEMKIPIHNPPNPRFI